MSKTDSPTYSHARRTDPANVRRALYGASTVPYWLDSHDRSELSPPLRGEVTGDLVVVGGGYCGLWTALMAKERDPGRRVILLEANRVGWAASGRNGGFCESSLTHGHENGMRHFPDELATLQRLAEQNFQEFEDSLVRYSIDAEFENSGILRVATEAHQVAALRAESRLGIDPEATFLADAELRQRGMSPVYKAGLFKRAGYAYVHPAKLVWGLKEVCLKLGVSIYETTPALTIRRHSSGVIIETAKGRVISAQAALATNGFPGLLKRARHYTVPIYDYALMTEPLTDDQLRSIGWVERFGITDSSREFHYYRKTADNRILFGGFDAIYHPGGRVRQRYDQRASTFELLADHFFTTFPPLTGIRFTHQWGGMIDMSSRLVAFYGRALGGAVAYAAGFTGLGVGATRFGANVMLDMLSGVETERTSLAMVRTKPIPIPPEPLATPLIKTMQRAVVKSDLNAGRNGPILKLADALGVGFDS